MTDYTVLNELGLPIQPSYKPERIKVFVNSDENIILEFSSNDNFLCLNFIKECIEGGLKPIIYFKISKLTTIYLYNTISYITITISDELVSNALKNNKVKIGIKDTNDKLLLYVK